MSRRNRSVVFVIVLVGILLLILPISIEGQEPANSLSAPTISGTVDNDWKIFNTITIGEKSCVTIETRSHYISRCFDSPNIKVSDTVPLPDGNLGADMFVTRVSVANGVECLVTTSTNSEDNGSIACSSDVHLIQ